MRFSSIFFNNPFDGSLPTQSLTQVAREALLNRTSAISWPFVPIVGGVSGPKYSMAMI